MYQTVPRWCRPRVTFPTPVQQVGRACGSTPEFLHSPDGRHTRAAGLRRPGPSRRARGDGPRRGVDRGALPGADAGGGRRRAGRPRTLLVLLDEGADVSAVRQPAGAASRRAAPGRRRRRVAVLEIPVTYDGEDLADVARLTGLSEREVVEAHTGTVWRVAFGGFAPGFGYLIGGDRRPGGAPPRQRSPRRCRPVPSAWPASSAACTHESRPGAGS